MAFVARRRDRPSRGYTQESDILRGEDNTEVSSTSAYYELKKTVRIYYARTSKPLTEVFCNYKVANQLNDAGVKLTATTPTQSETTVLERVNVVSEAKFEIPTSYQFETAPIPNTHQAGDWVDIKVYLKCYQYGAYNQTQKNYGRTKSEVIYY